MSVLSDLIDSLTPAQQRVLGHIAINRDLGHSPRVLRRLVELGLVKEYAEMLPGHPPVKVKRYLVPIRVHVAWCAWCSAHYIEDTDDENS